MIDYPNLQATLRAGGLLPDAIVSGGLQRCRVDGDHPGRRSGAYRLFDDERPSCPWWNWKTGASGVWFSEGLQATDADYRRMRLLYERERLRRVEEQKARWARHQAKLMRLWDRGWPVTEDCPAGLYFRRRGIGVPCTDALRFVDSLNYWNGDGTRIGSFPALLAAVTTPTGDLAAIHRTYLTSEGHKAPVPVVRKLTATSGPMAGASIKIGMPSIRADSRLGLGVAEGIETALAASALHGVPVWPCISANGLAAFQPPEDVKQLYIFADHDENGVGQAAASKLARRVAATGGVVRILVPEVPGDWNDELMARRAAI